jgi:hypothetical protein
MDEVNNSGRSRAQKINCAKNTKGYNGLTTEVPAGGGLQKWWPDVEEVGNAQSFSESASTRSDNPARKQKRRSAWSHSTERVSRTAFSSFWPGTANAKSRDRSMVERNLQSRPFSLAGLFKTAQCFLFVFVNIENGQEFCNCKQILQFLS